MGHAYREGDLGGCIKKRAAAGLGLFILSLSLGFFLFPGRFLLFTMRTTFIALALAAVVVAKSKTPLSQQLADSAISRAQGSLPAVKYETGVFQRSLEVCLFGLLLRVEFGIDGVVV